MPSFIVSDDLPPGAVDSVFSSYFTSRESTATASFCSVRLLTFLESSTESRRLCFFVLLQSECETGLGT
ncbi:hypothetical protein ACHAW6_008579 [Cyclotella cf. meneghiniana]